MVGKHARPWAAPKYVQTTTNLSVLNNRGHHFHIRIPLHALHALARGSSSCVPVSYNRYSTRWLLLSAALIDEIYLPITCSCGGRPTGDGLITTALHLRVSPPPSTWPLCRATSLSAATVTGRACWMSSSGCVRGGCN